jgi:hypothetical protein
MLVAVLFTDSTNGIGFLCRGVACQRT